MCGVHTYYCGIKSTQETFKAGILERRSLTGLVRRLTGAKWKLIKAILFIKASLNLTFALTEPRLDLTKNKIALTDS